MAIEFRCTQCNRLLRTGDHTAGKRAKCPECGAILAIPAAGTAPADEAPSAPPPLPPGAQPASPFGPGGTQRADYDPENPYAAPAEYGVPMPAQPPPPGAFTPTIIDFGDVFSRTWAIFKQQWGMCLAVVLLGWIIATVGFLVLFFGPMIAGIVAQDEVLLVLGVVAGCVLGLLFMTWMMIGMIRVLLAIARGEVVEISKLFSGASQLVPVFLTAILLTLITAGIFLVCALPGILLAAADAEEVGLVVVILGLIPGYVLIFIVSLMFSQAYFLIIDRGVGVIDSLKISKQITTGNKLTLFLLWLVGGALYMVSAIPCGLGLLVSIPFLLLMATVVYLAMTGQRTADQLFPAQPIRR